MIFGAGRGEAGIEFAVEGISETIEVKNLLFLVEVLFFTWPGSLPRRKF